MAFQQRRAQVVDRLHGVRPTLPPQLTGSVSSRDAQYKSCSPHFVCGEPRARAQLLLLWGLCQLAVMQAWLRCRPHQAASTCSKLGCNHGQHAPAAAVWAECMACKISRACAVQVFRTYNASVTLDRLLWSNEDGLPGDGIAHEGTVDLKKASYDRANKEVQHSSIKQRNS